MEKGISKYLVFFMTIIMSCLGSMTDTKNHKIVINGKRYFIRATIGGIGGTFVYSIGKKMRTGWKYDEKLEIYLRTSSLRPCFYALANVMCTQDFIEISMGWNRKNSPRNFLRQSCWDISLLYAFLLLIKIEKQSGITGKNKICDECTCASCACANEDGALKRMVGSETAYSASHLLYFSRIVEEHGWQNDES